MSIKNTTYNFILLSLKRSTNFHKQRIYFSNGPLQPFLYIVNERQSTSPHK